MKFLGTIVIAALLVAIMGAASLASAQVRLDAPSIQAIDSEKGLFQITVEVQAGASGAPAGFVIEWMRKIDYDAGGWPAVEYGPGVEWCSFYGVSTLNPTYDSDGQVIPYRLAAGAVVRIQLGDLFDETGSYASYGDGLNPGEEYVFRVHARASAEAEESDYSTTESGTTLAIAECTQGFWKNHPEVWPESCTPMLLGTVAYTKQQLLDIFNTPAQGNGLIFLAHQLIAAKLNICNGSDPAPLGTAIADADALIDGQVVPPVGGGFIAPGDASGLTETLDKYNNGKLGGVVNCPTPVRHTTWGDLKGRYR